MENLVSLREYVDLRFGQVEKEVLKAERAMTLRLEGMNEFRDTLKDQASRFVTREETSLMLKPLEKAIGEHDDEIRDLQLTRSELAGKASQTTMTVTLFISLAGLVLSIIKLFS